MPRITDRVRRWRLGLAAMAAGVIILTVGLLQTTAAEPVVAPPDGTARVAKFEFTGREYVDQKPREDETVVTITAATARRGEWSSSVPISALIIKGGPGAVIISYAAPQTTGTFSNADLPKVELGDRPSISIVVFCEPEDPPPTTTTSTTTSTTTTTTTTAPLPTTTTTAPVPTTAATTTTTTTTTAPPTSTSTVGSQTVTTLSTTTTTVGITVTVLGDHTSELPFTGSPSIPLAVFGCALIALGAALTMVSRFQARRVRT